MKKIILGFLVILFCCSGAFAGQAIRVGVGLPNGTYGEYEYKVLLDQVGFYANIGGMSGSVSTLAGQSTDVSLNSWGVGARYYIPLIGINIKGGIASLTADGDISGVPATAKLTTFDVGLGYEVGLGPVMVGAEVGMIMGKPDITSTVAPTGAFADVFDVDSIMYGKVFVGFKF